MPMKIKGGDKGWASQPVWADADAYREQLEAEQELEAIEKEERKRAAQQQAAATAAAASNGQQQQGRGGEDAQMAGA